MVSFLKGDEIYRKRSFTGQSDDGDVDEGERHDLRNSFDGPVLMLWVAAGCS